eukprot:3565243-Ditylum_brightwellii.AAC.1
MCQHIKTNHISAQDLSSLTAPTLLQHIKLSRQDNKIWDRSYKAECQGLEQLNTWKIISDTEYEAIRKITGPALPTVAILCVKYDTEGNLVQAKYRIVALDNLDTNT